jgi:hypothetical protein
VVGTSILLGIAAKLFHHNISPVSEMATVVAKRHFIAFTASTSAPPGPLLAQKGITGSIGQQKLENIRLRHPDRHVAVLFLLGFSSSLVSPSHLARRPLRSDLNSDLDVDMEPLSLPGIYDSMHPLHPLAPSSAHHRDTTFQNQALCRVYRAQAAWNILDIVIYDICAPSCCKPLRTHFLNLPLL